MIINLIFKAVGGLGLFMLGMTMMTTGLKMSAGNRIKNILSAVSSNRIIGCLTGAIVTAIIQSSSATTIILIGFVSAGLISLEQSIGIILGANVGTTMTAQLIAFKLSNIAMPGIAVGVAMKIFSKKKKTQYYGEIILGLGLVFYGMSVMKNGLSPLKSNSVFLDFFTSFSPDSKTGLVLSVLAGAIITILIQSSSATIGLTMALASQGLINFPGAMALVLGENIGTTITAELATIGSQNLNAIRAARAHTMFNVIGVTIILIIFPIFIKMVESITMFLGAEPVNISIQNGDTNNIARYIANGHTMFNVLNAIFFLFSLKWLTKMAIMISPKSKNMKNSYNLPNFGNRLANSPIALIPEVKNEVAKMAKFVKNTFSDTIKEIKKKNNKYNQLSKWKKIENYIDKAQKIIMSCLMRIYQNDLSESESKEVSSLMKMTNNIERIGDSIENIAHAIETLIDEKINLNPSAVNDIRQLSKKVLEFIDLIIEGILNGDTKNFIKRSNILENKIDIMRQEMKQFHINMIGLRIYGFDQGLIYIDILSNLEKIGDYCFNIAYAINEKK